MSLPKDFDFISNTASAFFKKAHIKKTLVTIDECSITGWEKWLQIELSAFLQSRDDIKAWGRESSYELDKRVAASRKKCAVDFLVHQKWKQSHMAIEIKQFNSAKSCIKAMMRDKVKIQKIKSTKYDIRSTWCIGVHKKCEDSIVKRWINFYSDELNYEISSKYQITKQIGYSPFMYTVF